MACRARRSGPLAIGALLLEGIWGVGGHTARYTLCVEVCWGRKDEGKGGLGCYDAVSGSSILGSLNGRVALSGGRENTEVKSNDVQVADYSTLTDANEGRPKQGQGDG